MLFLPYKSLEFGRYATVPMCGRGLATRGNSLVKAQPQRQTSEGQPDLKEHKYQANIIHHASFVFFHYFSYRHFSCRKDRFTVIILE